MNTVEKTFDEINGVQFKVQGAWNRWVVGANNQYSEKWEYWVVPFSEVVHCVFSMRENSKGRSMLKDCIIMQIYKGY